MARKKKTGNLTDTELDMEKLEVISKLKKLGYDTASKVRSFDPRDMYEKGLKEEMGQIFELQDAIKASHGELAWIMDGEDPKTDDYRSA